MQRILDWLTERAMDAIREQAIETGALIDLVEVNDRLALEQDSLAIARAHGRTVSVV